MPTLYHFATFSAFHRHHFVNFTCFLCLHAITLSSFSHFANSMCNFVPFRNFFSVSPPSLCQFYVFLVFTCHYFMFIKQLIFTTQMFTKQKFTNTLCLQNKIQNRKFTKQKFTNTLCLQNKIQKLTNTLCLQNKRNVYKTNVYKTKVYKHIMFTKQNTKQKVYKTKLKFTNTLFLQNKTKVYKHVMFTKHKTKVYKHVIFTKQNKCLQHKCLQNKSLLTRYVYKTKYKTESLQNKTKVYKHVMFIKQNTKQKVYKTKLKFTNTLCLQNKIQKFTKQNKCLQNKNKIKIVQASYVYKTKYKTENLQNTLCL